MTQKDTSPLSSSMNSQEEDEDVISIDDVEEVIDAYDIGEIEDEDVEEEVTPRKGDEICMFNGHRPNEENSKTILGSVFCGSLTKDGKLAATGGEDDRAYIWDASSGEIFLHCTGHVDSIIFTEFNHDETYLASGDMSGLIQVWRLSDKVKIWEYNMGDATWMKWHMAASVLLAGSASGEMYMWKVPGDDCKVFQGYGCRVETAAIFADGKRIVVGYEDGSIRVMDLKTSSVLSTIPSTMGHSAAITSIDCHLDNNLVLSAAVDGKTIISTSNAGKIVSILQDLNASAQNKDNDDKQDDEENDGNSVSNWVETAVFCKDPLFQVAATGTLNGEIFVWDVLKQVLRQKMEQESGISKLVWMGNSTILFGAGLDGILRCFDGKNGQCLRSFTGHTADILDLYISENGKRALTTSDDSTARIFDISSLS